jgi:hypothetical protein
MSGITTATHISVENYGGQTSLLINSSDDGGTNVTINAATVDFGGMMINYYTQSAPNGGTVGVTSVTLHCGSGSSIDAESVQSTTTFKLVWAPGDTISGPDANMIHEIDIFLPPSLYTGSITTVSTVSHL